MSRSFPHAGTAYRKRWFLPSRDPPNSFGHERPQIRALLLSAVLGVNMMPKECGDTALVWASNNGQLVVVRALLNDEAVNVNFKDEDGATALYYASHNGHVEVVRALLEHDGVDVNIKDNDGETALMVASEFGHLEVVRALLNHDGVDVNVKDIDGKTALIAASEFGHLEVVRALLNHHEVDVNIKDNDDRTALIVARRNGHLEVVQALLNHEGVDVNVIDKYGYTALKISRMRPKDGVAHRLEENMKRLKLLEEKNPAGSGAKHLESCYRPDRNENSPSSDDSKIEEEQKHRGEEEQKRRKEEEQRKTIGWTWNALTWATSWGSLKVVSGNDAKIEQDRNKLLHVMNTISVDPVEFSLEYIERCIKKDHKLGSGAFGDIYLAEDSRLPKKFAVKRIRLTHFDEDTIKEIRRSFQRELSTLKRFRHPNIIALYGFSLNADSTQQCLVYEYASNGSLAGFLTDDVNRVRLSADTRLSIMFELTRAVHYLHTGGCKVKGKRWNVFHRDIKSANICLADNFSPRLIDCGLAKFVPDDNSNASPESIPVSLRSSAGRHLFGTPGYMCPEYVKKKTRGLPCPYIAAYDVYSIGIVMVELVLGCLTGGRSTPNGTQFLDVFEMYVQDERGRLVVNGWERLKRDADPTVRWNAASLELVCKAAIHCMAPLSDERLSTKDLLDKLRGAIGLNTDTGNRHPEAVNTVDRGPCCDFCNENGADLKCSEGHALCTSCIEDKLGDDSGCQLLCLIKGCSSQPFQDEDLYGRIPMETYTRYVEKRAERQMWDEWILRFELQLAGFQSQLFGRLTGFQSQLSGKKSDLHGIKEDVKIGFDDNEAQLQKQQQMLQELAIGLDRSLAALALLSADQFKECPNVVWMTPVSVDKKYLKYPKKWFTEKYSVVFVCARSGDPGHVPFDIDMPRKWIVKIAPWLKLCLQVIKAISKSQALPFPDPDLPFFEQCEMMEAFIDSVLEEASNAVVEHCEACEALIENGTISIDTYGQVQTLAGGAFKFIAEKARKEKRSLWMPPQMVPVVDKNGTPIWVKGEYAKFYGLRGNYEDDTTST